MKDLSTIKISVFIVLMLLNFSCDAEIYKWVDARGKAHFTDKPPAGKKSETIELRINTYTAVEIKPLVERLGKKDKVVIYTATWCGVCKKAKRYFRKNNIPYVAYDVEKDKIGKIDFKLLGGESVPVIIIGDRRMNGFTVSWFDRLYKKVMAEKEAGKTI